MADDEREKEREFLQGLKARTGRDLAGWMAAIAAQGFSDKNEIIDWLRTQGLPFARASWLERIHRNGGRPIHSDNGGQPSECPPEAERPADARPPPKAAPARPTAGDAGALEKLLAAAKGYRPLYHLLEAEVRKAIPGSAFLPKVRYVSVAAPREFAVVTLHATEVRLGLDLGEYPFGGRLEPARLRGPGPAISHMVVLTDARQVDADLLALLNAANGRVNA